MSTLFSSPSPPPAYEPPKDDSEEKAKEAREEALARKRRGRDGTILTSALGYLSDKNKLPQRKTLLGE